MTKGGEIYPHHEDPVLVIITCRSPELYGPSGLLFFLDVPTRSRDARLSPI